MAIRVVPDTYGTIALAYAAANNDDTIYIKESGSPYTEPTLQVLKRLKFEGESTNVLIYRNALLFWVKHSDVEFTNIHLRCDSSAAVVLIDVASNTHIHHCKLERTTSFGNDLVRNAHGGAARIEYNDFYGDVEEAIFIYQCSGLQKVLGNTFHGEVGVAIYLINNDVTLTYEFQDNTIEHIGTATALGRGIRVEGTPLASGLIKGNIITGTLQGVLNGSKHGIELLLGEAEITENYVTGSYRYNPIFLTSTCDNCEVHYNDFTGGASDNAKDDGSGNVWDKNSKGNYWGYGGVAYDGDCNYIGDSPEAIAGLAGTQDDYPLMCSIGIWSACPYTCGAGSSILLLLSKMLLN